MRADGKLEPAGGRVSVPVSEVRTIGLAVLNQAGCKPEIAQEVIDHLIDADLCGVESHGIFRAKQYADEYRRGYLNPHADPQVDAPRTSTLRIDGQGGIGIVAMGRAVDAGVEAAQAHGVAAIAVENIGHTGRLGDFGERAARAGCLFIACGGGARQNWRMVAPYGGSNGKLPTNPWCLGIPGGAQGPVVLDCATGQIAGGWIYAARQSDALLPEGAIIDAQGRPTRNPADFFNGGAILPKGGVLGYGLATMGELICDAMLGPAKVECNTFILMVDTTRYRGALALQEAAEEILADLRSCPPAPGFDAVQVPGEREQRRKAGRDHIEVPISIWNGLRHAAAEASVKG